MGQFLNMTPGEDINDIEKQLEERRSCRGGEVAEEDVDVHESINRSICRVFPGI